MKNCVPKKKRENLGKMDKLSEKNIKDKTGIKK